MFLTSLLRILLTRSFKSFRFERGQSAVDIDPGIRPGLYVHVPFCRSLCFFCPYCKVLYDPKLAERYSTALVGEIEQFCSGLEDKIEASSLYFGGGTPALLTENMGGIIRVFKKYFEIWEGIGVELHPNDLSAGILDLLREAGVNMISIGAQSFDGRSLSVLQRNNSKIEAGLELAAGAGFDVVDIDLIFALPGQTEETLLTDIDKAFSLGATQVSTYPFIDFGFSHTGVKPLSERGKKKMLQAIASYCADRGLQRTSVWTFARPGTGRYSSVTRNAFIGFGPSAATLANRRFKVNTFSITAYLEALESGKSPAALGLSFSELQKAAYHLFWSAYALRIDRVEFEKLTGRDPDQLYRLELAACRALGLVRKAGGGHVLTDRGAWCFQHVEQAYTKAYISKMWQTAGAEAFPKEVILY